MELPASLRKIGQGAFALCRNLKTVKFADRLETLGANERFINNQGFYGVFQESAVEHVGLPSTLKQIEYSTFEKCENLKSIALPN